MRVDFVKSLHAHLLFCRGTVLTTQEVVVFCLERSLWAAPPADAMSGGGFESVVHLLRKCVIAEVHCQEVLLLSCAPTSMHSCVCVCVCVRVCVCVCMHVC